jgi:hypothetical protein
MSWREVSRLVANPSTRWRVLAPVAVFALVVGLVAFTSPLFAASFSVPSAAKGTFLVGAVVVSAAVVLRIYLAPFIDVPTARWRAWQLALAVLMIATVLSFLLWAVWRQSGS